MSSSTAGEGLRYAEYSPPLTKRLDADIDQGLAMSSIAVGLGIAALGFAGCYTFQIWKPLGQVITETAKKISTPISKLRVKRTASGDLQDGGGVRRGDHLPPHKYIKNTSTCGTTHTEYLLNAGRRPQTSQKARNSPHTWPCGSQDLGALAGCQA